MATKRPRVSVVLDEDVAATVRQVAAMQGRSVSALIGELVTEMEPGLRRVVRLGEAIEQASQEQKEAIRLAVAESEKHAAALIGEAMEWLDSGDVTEGRPPLGNTGVRLL